MRFRAYKHIVLNAGRFLLATAVAVAVAGAAPFHQRLPGSAQEAVATVEELESAVGMDSERQVLVLPYDKYSMQALVYALDSPFDEVKVAALEMLALAVKQLEIPNSELHETILPAVVEADQLATASAVGTRLAELARRVLWHAKIKALPRGEQRLAFLRTELDNRQDGYYYPFEALDYIAAIGTESSRVVLVAKLDESRMRSLSEKLVQQIRVAHREVEIQISLSRSDVAAQAAELKTAFLTSLEDRSFAGQSLRVWLIRQVADRRLEELDGLLAQVSADETLEPRVRYEAEHAVRQLKGLAGIGAARRVGE